MNPSPLERANPDLKIRAFTRADGKVTSLRLDVFTWQAIEQLAAQRGQRWQDWAAEVLDANPETNNMAGSLRQAAIAQLMSGATGAGAITLSSEHQIAGRVYRRVTDKELKSFLKESQVIHEDRKFTIFSVLIGFHGPKQTPFVCIRSQLLGGLHLLLERGGDER